MPWSYYASTGGITPVVDAPNISLESGASEIGEIFEFNFSGQATTSTAMETSVMRAAEGVGAATAVPVSRHEENAPAPNLAATLGDHATTPPAPTVGDFLYNDSWNAQGGQVKWFAERGEEIIMLGVATVIQENQVGVAVSSYGFRWRER